MMFLVAILLLCILVLYTGTLLRMGLAWHSEPLRSVVRFDEPIRVTVIIPVRNEALNLPQCLMAVLKQEYSDNCLEVIVSDDHSEDGTIAVAHGFTSQFTARGIVFRVVHALASEATGKKAALERAIIAATGTLIVTTDADCRMGKQWVAAIAGFQQQTGASMVVPLVELDPAGGCFHQMQALEFAGLTGSGAASLIAGIPLMCNGANLAFLKHDFTAVGGYTAGGATASGDDTFLMFELNHAKPGSVRFLKSTEAIVTARSAATFSELLSQRFRWISKVKRYSIKGPAATGALVAGANLALIILALAVFAEALSPSLLFCGFLVKCAGDLFLLHPVLDFLGRRRLLLLFLPAALLLPLYFLLSGWFMVFPSGYKWKNRTYPG